MLHRFDGLVFEAFAGERVQHMCFVKSMLFFILKPKATVLVVVVAAAYFVVLLAGWAYIISSRVKRFLRRMASEQKIQKNFIKSVSSFLKNFYWGVDAYYHWDPGIRQLLAQVAGVASWNNDELNLATVISE